MDATKEVFVIGDCDTLDGLSSIKRQENLIRQCGGRATSIPDIQMKFEKKYGSRALKAIVAQKAISKLITGIPICRTKEHDRLTGLNRFLSDAARVLALPIVDAR